jgi:hypothetical protein
MDRIRGLVPAVLACCTAVLSLAASAQSELATGKRQKVDVRAMVPGPQPSDAGADARPAGGLTRDQRKEATLRARQDGTLRPTGDAADQRDAKAEAVSAAGDSSTVPVATPEAAGEVSPPTQVAAATPPPAKKSKSKKARPPAASAPA